MRGGAGAGPGEPRAFQVWYRDPGGSCGAGFNLSTALSLVLLE